MLQSTSKHTSKLKYTHSQKCNCFLIKAGTRGTNQELGLAHADLHTITSYQHDDRHRDDRAVTLAL